MWVGSSWERAADDAVIWVCLESSTQCVLTSAGPGGVCSCWFCAGCRVKGITAGKLGSRDFEVGSFGWFQGPVVLEDAADAVGVPCPGEMVGSCFCHSRGGGCRGWDTRAAAGQHQCRLLGVSCASLRCAHLSFSKGERYVCDF